MMHTVQVHTSDLLCVETPGEYFALCMGGMYMSSGFAGVCRGPSRFDFVSSLTDSICLHLFGLLNCSRGLLVVSAVDGTWSDLGYLGEKVFAWREACTDNAGAGVLVVTARSGVV